MSKKLMIYITTSILILGIGITYAWITWGSEDNTAVEFTIGNIADVKFYEGTNIISNDLAPTLTYEEGELLEFSVNVRNTEEYYINVTMTSEILPSELQEESLKYRIYKESELISEGNFSEIIEGETKVIGSRIEVEKGLTNFKIYIWIDGNMENPLDMRNKNMKLIFNAEASGPLITDASGANPPVLYEGMIPIKWNENNEVVKSDITNPKDNNWYNYDAKMWANAVMVSSDTRETYMNAEVGTPITESDILAYWVWIPRYRYQLWNVGPDFEVATYDEEGNCSGNCPDTIEIIFESATTPKSINNEVDKWLTHPAFSFGNGGEEGYTELSGIWVGKFETSVSTENICYTTPNETNCSKQINDLRIIPNVQSLTFQQLAYQYLSSRTIENQKYLTENGVNSVDSHMMKNTEWGAVVYLSHSKYGINEEIYANNSNEYITGRSGGAVIPESTLKYGGYTYDGKIVNEDGSIGEIASDISLGTKASTTGNIYGIYDMKGALWEHVMGNYNRYSGQRNNEEDKIHSGFNGSLYAGDPITDGIEFPADKYVNIYDNPTNLTTDYSESILGDAIGETAGWYKDYSGFINYYAPWFVRGGKYYDLTFGGVFAFSSNYGNVRIGEKGDPYYTFRITLTDK